MQSILVDYLGLSKEGRETRTLVEIYPEYFLVQPAPSGGEGAFVTLRDDAPHIGEDEEEASMADMRRAVDEQEAEELAARRPADEGEVLFGDDPRWLRRGAPAAASSAAAAGVPADVVGPGNLDIFPEVVRADLALGPSLAESRGEARRQAAEARAAFDRVRRGARADGAPKRRPRPRGG